MDKPGEELLFSDHTPIAVFALDRSLTEGVE
jgi:hypothetical protein